MNKINSIINICEDLAYAKCKNFYDNASGYILTRQVYDKNTNAITRFLEVSNAFLENSAPNHLFFELDGDMQDFARLYKLKRAEIVVE